MSDGHDIYERLLQQGFTKQEIDSALHKATLIRIKEKRKRQSMPLIKRIAYSFFSILHDSYFFRVVRGRILCFFKKQSLKKSKNLF